MCHEYDAHDNRTSKQTGAAQAEVGTHDAQDKLLTYAGRSYNHDGRGRVTGWSQGAQDTTLEWDADDRLAAITMPNGQRVSYRFDTSGRRAAVDLDGVTQHLFLFNGLQLLAQQDASGQLTQRYVYATHGHVPDLMWRQGQWYRLIKDVRGSVRLVVSIDDGSISQRLDYDAFGRVLADSSPGFQPFGFAGGIYDHRTQLVLFGFRSYDPLSGRFLSRDPLWHGGGHSNLYLYVANDPINFIDSDWLWPVWVVPVVVKGVKLLAAGSSFLLTYHAAGMVENSLSQPKNPGQYSMIFFRKSGKLMVLDNSGGLKVYPASSGLGDGLNVPKAEVAPGYGPIPAGRYYISAKDMSNPAAHEDFLRNKLNGDWGDWRIRIYKKTFENELIKRDDFFLHGGGNPGSKGCIDIGGGIFGDGNSDEILGAVRGDEDGNIPLRVY